MVSTRYPSLAWTPTAMAIEAAPSTAAKPATEASPRSPA